MNIQDKSVLDDDQEDVLENQQLQSEFKQQIKVKTKKGIERHKNKNLFYNEEDEEDDADERNILTKYDDVGE